MFKINVRLLASPDTPGALLTRTVNMHHSQLCHLWTVAPLEVCVVVVVLALGVHESKFLCIGCALLTILPVSGFY